MPYIWTNKKKKRKTNRINQNRLNACKRDLEKKRKERSRVTQKKKIGSPKLVCYIWSFFYLKKAIYNLERNMCVAIENETKEERNATIYRHRKYWEIREINCSHKHADKQKTKTFTYVEKKNETHLKVSWFVFLVFCLSATIFSNNLNNQVHHHMLDTQEEHQKLVVDKHPYLVQWSLMDLELEENISNQYQFYFLFLKCFYQ